MFFFHSKALQISYRWTQEQESDSRMYVTPHTLKHVHIWHDFPLISAVIIVNLKAWNRSCDSVFFLNKKICRVGLHFVHQELIGSLWFVIAKVSCEWQVVPPSRHKHVIKEDTIFCKSIVTPVLFWKIWKNYRKQKFKKK